MKIGIYSNMDKLCGNAEYARDLQYELEKLYPEPCYLGCDQTVLNSYDVILVSWSPSRVATTPELIRYWQASGKKVIVIWQESYPVIVDPGSWGVNGVLKVADAVVAHELILNGELKNVQYIPHGIPIVESLPPVIEEPLYLGVAGFPFSWKRFEVVARVARNISERLSTAVKARIIAPPHTMVDTEPYIRSIRDRYGTHVEIYRELMPREEVVKKLAECSLNIFWFGSDSVVDELGQSGSVRMGVAAGRPMIISRHRKFLTLMEFAEEFYVADDEAQVNSLVDNILFRWPSWSIRRPEMILKKQGWPEVGRQYKDLIEKVAA